MIVLDANILLYAYDSTSLHHKRARQWLEHALTSDAPVGIPWQTVSAFLRIMTNSRLPGERFTTKEAITVIEQWFSQPNVQRLSPGDSHWSLFQQMILEGQAQGPLIMDAQLAALTIEVGGVLHTVDRDFARFPKLRWLNPLK